MHSASIVGSQAAHRLAAARRLLVLLTVLAESAWSCVPESPTIPGTSASHPLPQPVPATLAAAETDQGMGCYYEWSTRELPGLTESLRTELTRLNPGIEARAYAFGEDCVEASGTTTFLPMETDFQIMIPVASLTDEARLGAWIKTVLVVIGNIPPGELSGPQPGRVAFEFRPEGSESLRLTVSLSDYTPNIQRLEDGALLRHFLPPQ